MDEPLDLSLKTTKSPSCLITNIKFKTNVEFTESNETKEHEEGEVRSPTIIQETPNPKHNQPRKEICFLQKTCGRDVSSNEVLNVDDNQSDERDEVSTQGNVDNTVPAEINPADDIFDADHHTKSDEFPIKYGSGSLNKPDIEIHKNNLPEVVDGDTSSIEMTCNGVTLSVVDPELWKSFKEIQNEMIINRGGRRMFPYIAVRFRGLRSEALYDVMLDIVPADNMRYKYVNDVWVPVGRTESTHTNLPFLHHECPCFGEDLMKKSLSFSRVKLTNSKDFAEGKMLLQSMCKYTMRISVIEREGLQRVFPFMLKETTFVAVTAYQNSRITHLKIQNNPFAKAFRKPRQKRTSLESLISDDESPVLCKNKALSPSEKPDLSNQRKWSEVEESSSSSHSAKGGSSIFSETPVPFMRDMSIYNPWLHSEYRMLAAAVSYQSQMLALRGLAGNAHSDT